MVSGNTITSPIDTVDPYTLLGLTPSADYSVGEAITKGSINQWSFYKPIVASKTPTLNKPDDFYTYNDGFTISTYNYPSQVIQACINSDYSSWVYTKPTDGNQLRLTDWNGYDKGATNWFTLTGSKSSAGAGETVTFSMARSSFPTEFLNFAAMSAYKGSTQNVLSHGLVFQKSGASTSSTALFYKYCSNLSGGDYDDTVGYSLTIPATTTLSTGTWKVVPTITTYTNMNDGTWLSIKEEGEYGTWWCFPATPFTLTIKTTTSVEDQIKSDITVYVYIDGYYVSGTSFEISMITVDIENSGTSAYSGTVSGNMVNCDISGEVTLTSPSFSVSANSSTTVTVFNGDKDGTVIRGEAYDTSSPIIEVDVTVKYGNTSVIISEGGYLK